MENRKLNRGAFIAAVAALAVSGALFVYAILVAPDMRYAPPPVRADIEPAAASSEVLSEPALGITFSYPSDMFDGTPEVLVHEARETCLTAQCNMAPMSIGSVDLVGPGDWLRIVVFSNIESLDSFTVQESGLTAEEYVGGLKHIGDAVYVGPATANQGLDGGDAAEYRIFANNHLYFVIHGIFDGEWHQHDDDWLLESLSFSVPE